MLIRYPGGKRWLAKNVLAEVEPHELLVEPFAGAAHIGWSHALRGGASMLNDLDRGIHALWYAVVHDPEELCEAVLRTTPTTEMFSALKGRVLAGELDGTELALAKIVLHQCSYSGLGERSGPLGGLDGSGKYGIACRWNPTRIVAEIRRLSAIPRAPFVTGFSWEDVIVDVPEVFYYVDPPYVGQGSALYSLGSIDHVALAERLLSLTDSRWLLSYDDCPEVRGLYASASIESVEMSATITAKKRMPELLIRPAR